MGLIENITKTLEEKKKAIPSQVFFNHFYALSYYITNSEDQFDLKKIDYYNKLTLKNQSFELQECKKLLWNAWSTEYAYFLSNSIENLDFYKYSLHWNFPQAYYSIYLTMTAFHQTQGIANDQHEKSIKIFGNGIKDNHYPKSISFYSRGLYNDVQFEGLEDFNGFPKDFSVLSRVHDYESAQIQIASFLKSTRELNAKDKRKRAAKSNDKRFLTNNGTFRKKFSKQHWDLIYTSIPETTILNIIYRLRIKANYNSIETFMNAEIDFRKFHIYLGEIINYMNFIHEAYICKAIGNEKYEHILNDFIDHMDDKRSIKRYEVIQSL
jgi:hypothetical protein